MIIYVQEVVEVKLHVLTNCLRVGNVEHNKYVLILLLLILQIKIKIKAIYIDETGGIEREAAIRARKKRRLIKYDIFKRDGLNEYGVAEVRAGHAWDIKV